MNPAHIFLVEDDINLSFVTRDNLEKEGYKVTCSSDGLEAWKLYNAHTFDLCILDVMLPGEDGFTLAKKIRQHNAQIPILFLTAKSLKENRLEGFKNGGDDYITKPFSIEELVLRIEIFLKRRFILSQSASPSPDARLSTFEFDYPNLILKTSTKSHTLTQKEADVLKLLTDNTNQLLKREDILKSLWGDDDYFMGRSLDVFISRLRKLFKEDPSVRITTIHGIGFKLEIGSREQKE